MPELRELSSFRPSCSPIFGACFSPSARTPSKLHRQAVKQARSSRQGLANIASDARLRQVQHLRHGIERPVGTPSASSLARPVGRLSPL